MRRSIHEQPTTSVQEMLDVSLRNSIALNALGRIYDNYGKRVNLGPGVSSPSNTTESETIFIDSAQVSPAEK